MKLPRARVTPHTGAACQPRIHARERDRAASSVCRSARPGPLLQLPLLGVNRGYKGLYGGGWPLRGMRAAGTALGAADARTNEHYEIGTILTQKSQGEGMSLPRFDPAAKSCSLEPRPTLPSRLQLLSSPEDRCLICCLPAVAAGEPGGPLYYKEVLTRCPPAIFYPHDSERECDRTIGSFCHQSEIAREH